MGMLGFTRFKNTGVSRDTYKLPGPDSVEGTPMVRLGN